MIINSAHISLKLSSVLEQLRFVSALSLGASARKLVV